MLASIKIIHGDQAHTALFSKTSTVPDKAHLSGATRRGMC